MIASSTVELLDTNGRVVASATAASRTRIRIGDAHGNAPAVFMPRVTTSDSRAYFLDGDSIVRSLKPDGTSALVTHIPGSASAEATFAVRADDGRIAVSVIDYGPSPPTVRLYAEDLTTGAHHVEIFSSSSLYVWPVAWRGTALVLAVGPAAAQYAADNPYDAIGGYHVVDATTGNRLAAICTSPSAPVGVINETGTLCLTRTGAVSLARWDGSFAAAALPGDCQTMSPGGGLVACGGGTSSAPTGPISVRRIGGTATATPAQGFGPLGWIDDEHLLFAAGSNSDGDIRLLNTNSGAITPVGSYSQLGGRLKGR